MEKKSLTKFERKKKKTSKNEKMRDEREQKESFSKVVRKKYKKRKNEKDLILQLIKGCVCRYTSVSQFWSRLNDWRFLPIFPERAHLWCSNKLFALKYKLLTAEQMKTSKKFNFRYTRGMFWTSCKGSFFLWREYQANPIEAHLQQTDRQTATSSTDQPSKININSF